MDEYEIIGAAVDAAVEICSPCAVYLVSAKHSNSGELSGFKLCIVVPDGNDPSDTERKLLLGTDTPVPCDFIVYTLTEWEDCAEDDCSFAYRVENGGELLYVKE